VVIIDAYTALDMPQGKEWFESFFRFVPSSVKIFVVGFINGRKSLTYKLSKDLDWATHRYPAINEEGESIDPARFPVEHFLQIRRQQEQLFQMNYQQNPPYGD